ncbi:MAG: glutamine amidotransferase [Gammaproteobacteria bacterium]|nr:glutamine amidotransferase [Gammaproteobacteria bacterium]
MGKPILIIKTGNTIASLLNQGEDFEDWFIAQSQFPADNFVVKSLHLDEELDELNSIAGIIITGSAAYVTDEEAWNFVGADYVRKAHKLGIPILGVCYGHQLVAWAFGGEVDFQSGGREIGTVAIELTAAAKKDPLFAGIPDEFYAQLSHQQSVTGLPVNAVRLATNQFEPNQAFRLGSTTWGIQFHPEFTARIIREYILARQDAILGEGLDAGQLLADIHDTPYSVAVLQKFCRLVFENV